MLIKKVGITGAAGNIGRTLTEGLEPKYALKLFDRVSIRSESHESRMLDFAEVSELSGAFEGIDALIHLAGNPNPSARKSDTIKNNFVATSLVFEEARKAGVKKIVFASSNFYHEEDIGKCLSGDKKSKITLGNNPTPLSMYGKSKLFGEQVGMYLSHLGISFAALRIGWTVPQDSPLPYDSPYMRAMFCSKRDLVQAFDKALECDESFVRGFATSNNDSGVFDLSETADVLGYHPLDNSADY